MYLLISFDHRFQFVAEWSSGLEVVFWFEKEKTKDQIWKALEVRSLPTKLDGIQLYSREH